MFLRTSNHHLHHRAYYTNINTNTHTLMFYHLQLKSFEFLHFFLTNPLITLMFHVFSTLHFNNCDKRQFFPFVFHFKRCHWAHLNLFANKSIFLKRILPKRMCFAHTQKIESPIRFTKE